MSVREADPVAGPGAVVTGREVAIGKYTTVRRFLPDRALRSVGAWCFVDHFGPEDLTRPSPAGRVGMWVPPHPHIGLQTVTWLYEGEVLHRDSLGTRQVIRPGGLNLMTSGRGIAHSEESVAGAAPVLHGLQLWVALPTPERDGPPRFAHHERLPLLTEGRVSVTVVLGRFAGTSAPAEVHTPLVGADLRIPAGAALDLPLEPGFEHALLVVSGEIESGGVRLPAGSLRHRPPGATGWPLRAAADTTAFLLGGVPFEDPLVMWWNFVGPDHGSIARARADWAAGRRFGVVEGFAGDPLPAPDLPRVTLVPRRRDGTRALGGSVEEGPGEAPGPAGRGS
ncbi:MAG: pirin family protein [Kineosporiaceae bacterium]